MYVRERFLQNGSFIKRLKKVERTIKIKTEITDRRDKKLVGLWRRETQR